MIVYFISANYISSKELAAAIRGENGTINMRFTQPLHGPAQFCRRPKTDKKTPKNVETKGSETMQVL